MSAQLLSIRNPGEAWARFIFRRPDVSIAEYSDGYELLNGPYAADWLVRGFEELLRAVRNSRST